MKEAAGLCCAEAATPSTPYVVQDSPGMLPITTRCFEKFLLGALGCSAWPEVREMNRIGMIVDVSNVSDKTFYDVPETTKPVIASHSSCFAYSEIPRNMKDDMFRALAKNGGVVGVNFGSSFLNQDADELKKRGRVGPGTCTPSRSQIPDVSLSTYPARATHERLPPSIVIGEFLRLAR